MDTTRDAHGAVRRWFDAAVKVADPREAVHRHLAFDEGVISVSGREIEISDGATVVVLAIGKAATGLAQGAYDVLSELIDRGVILTKYGHVQELVPGFDVYEASHPTPDLAGLDATASILESVRDLSSDDVVVALISGGGSALLELPRDGVSLEDMQDVTRRLMHAGAGIHDLNAVRKALSQVKGGGLRARIGHARCMTLLLSDVLGNDPSVIASGPTAPSTSGLEDALEVVRRFGIESDLPSAVMQVLTTPGNQTQEIDTSRDVVEVIADNAAFIREVADRARSEGRVVHVDEEPYEDDAAELGSDLAGVLATLPQDVDVFVRGGEATVAVTGDGVGGRNTEMALAAALALDGNDEWVVASLASDGDDGNSEAAGAIADGRTAGRAREAGIDPADALRRNDSASVFRKAGGIVETGPTGTNVNDVYVAVRCRRVSEKQGR